MLTLYAFEFTSNIAVWLYGGRRRNYKKWEKVVVTDKDRFQLLRLRGTKYLWERQVEYNDIFKWYFKKEKKAKEDKKDKEVKETAEVEDIKEAKETKQPEKPKTTKNQAPKKKDS